jgi:hypothetical protein
MHIWQIFRVSQEKLGHKVGWPELSNKLEAVFLPARGEDALLGDCLTIPIQTTYILPVENEATGYVVAAWLNSLPVRAYAVSFAEPAREIDHVPLVPKSRVKALQGPRYTSFDRLQKAKTLDDLF